MAFVRIRQTIHSSSFQLEGNFSHTILQQELEPGSPNATQIQRKNFDVNVFFLGRICWDVVREGNDSFALRISDPLYESARSGQQAASSQWKFYSRKKIRYHSLNVSPLTHSGSIFGAFSDCYFTPSIFLSAEISWLKCLFCPPFCPSFQLLLLISLAIVVQFSIWRYQMNKGDSKTWINN